MSEINWRTIDEVTFNELVEALLVTHYTKDGLVAQAVDGRGGDGGIDVDVSVAKTGQLVRIYQLKYFPEGMSGGNKDRRRQVQKSLQRAIDEHDPKAWVLVTTRKVTAQERKSIRGMRKGHPVTISFCGPPELDALLGEHPEIYERFYGDRTARALAAINRPEAAFKKPGDVASEVARMRDAVDGRSVYWGSAFGIDPDGVVSETLVAKRPDAALREPLNIEFSAVFGPEDEELEESFTSMLNYGSGREIVLPGRVVAEMRKIGPEWFNQTLKPSKVTLSAVKSGAEMSVALTLRDALGSKLASISGVAEAVRRGVIGWSLQQRLSGALSVEWRMPNDASEAGEFLFELEPDGVSARDVRRCISFLAAMSKASSLELAAQGERVTIVELEPGEGSPVDNRMQEFVEDLCLIDDKLDVAIIIRGDEVSDRDRKWARITAQLLRGEATPRPYTNVYSGTLNGEDSVELRGLLRDGSVMQVEEPNMKVVIMGNTLDIGLIRSFCHLVRADNAQDVEALLDRGEAAGYEIRVRPINSRPFVMYRPDSMPPGQRITPRPWGLTGIAEHPGFEFVPTESNARESMVEAQQNPARLDP